MVDAAVQHLYEVVGRVQAQLATLAAAHARLREDNEALRECLEASGLLSGQRFFARLHRRQFAGVLQRHPCSWQAGLQTVADSRELILMIAAAAGFASSIRLAAASRAMH